MKELENLIKSFNSAPILFIGSGIGMRYLNLPDWEGLLQHFAFLIEPNNPYIYNYYREKAKQEIKSTEDLLPKVAELISNDFNIKWLKCEIKHEVNSETEDLILSNRVSPFKAEVAHYINSRVLLKQEYAEEIKLLKELSQKNINSVITTNYDTLTEQLFPEFEVYIGQSQLLLSKPQGIAEIYKIHGSVTDPNSIVLTYKDYENFKSGQHYLTAKLLTMFIENPIIFLGYSINDSNIIALLEDIINCMETEEQINKLKNQLIFINYQPEIQGYRIKTIEKKLSEKYIEIKKIDMSDFAILYESLKNAKAKVPVGILRFFREEVYKLAYNDQPNNVFLVSNLDDPNIKNKDLAVAIGTREELGEVGYSSPSLDDYYRYCLTYGQNNYIGPNFEIEKIITITFPRLFKTYHKKVPIFRLLSLSLKDHSNLLNSLKEITFSSIVPGSIRGKIKTVNQGKYISLTDVWQDQNLSLSKKLLYLNYFEEEDIEITVLEEILNQLYNSPSVLHQLEASDLTNLRRLIRIFDYIKYGKVLLNSTPNQNNKDE